MAFFDKLKEQLSKTRNEFKSKLDHLFMNFRTVDEEFFEELEEILIVSDMGVEMTMELIDELRDECKLNKIEDPMEIQTLLKEKIKARIKIEEEEEEEKGLTVYLIVGVNGVGKTTTIGKLANLFKSEGKKVMLAAADTFRAAAIDQLTIWAERVDVPIIKHQDGADPGAVIYDAIQAAKARDIDVLICDTAGRLHNKKNLMNELSKLWKIISSELPDSKKEVFLVLDATTGQNAVSQTKVFSEATHLTGLIMTKMDGTAKGGILISLCSEFDVPVKYIGIGEKIEDIARFDPDHFVDAIL